MNIVFRVSGNEVEMLEHNDITGKDYFESVSLELLIKTLSILSGRGNKNYRRGLVIVDDDMIAINENCIVTKQPEHKRIVIYKGKAYEINFPNSIYMICHEKSKIQEIEAYCYIEYKGADTMLYKYAMPNMLRGNRICMGSAPKNIDPRKYQEALERVIFTQYTHDWVGDVKSFKSTKDYFEYLENNRFPYDLLVPLNYTLKQTIRR